MLSTQRTAESNKDLLGPRPEPTHSSPAWELQGPRGAEPTGPGEGETKLSAHRNPVLAVLTQWSCSPSPPGSKGPSLHSCSAWLESIKPPYSNSPDPQLVLHANTELVPSLLCPKYASMPPREPPAFNSIWSEPWDGQRHCGSLQTTLAFPTSPVTGSPRSVCVWWEHLPPVSVLPQFFLPPFVSLHWRGKPTRNIRSKCFTLPSSVCAMFTPRSATGSEQNIFSTSLRLSMAPPEGLVSGAKATVTALQS